MMHFIKKSWTSFVSRQAKNQLTYLKIKENLPYLHVPMEEPLMIVCSRDEAGSFLAGTSNLQYCGFITVKYVSREEGNILLGLMHFNGTDKAKQQLEKIAKFFAETAGEKCGDVQVSIEQNILGLSSYGWGQRFGIYTQKIYDLSEAIFKENGIHNISRYFLGGTRVCKNFSDENPVRFEPISSIPATFSEYFYKIPRYEYQDDQNLKEEFQEHRRECWHSFEEIPGWKERVNTIRNYTKKCLSPVASPR